MKEEKDEVVACKICKSDTEVVEFKDHCICEECVTYIKENC